MDSTRKENLRTALRLEYFTVGWNVIEGVIAVWAALAAGSVALMSFGLDSFIESTSGSILIWRLLAESKSSRSEAEIDHLDERAHKLVAVSLLVLAAYVAIDAVLALINAERPDASPVGIVLTSVSLAVMIFLARAKRKAAGDLSSKALKADAFQTEACWWLSLVALVGMALNAALDWWWADPAAALIIAGLIVYEAKEAWEGEDCC